MWITPETRKLCPFTKFSWSYPYFNILNEKSLGTQHRISAVKNLVVLPSPVLFQLS